MTKFEKPGAREWDYPDMGREAGTAALLDAGISYDLVQQAFVGYTLGDTTSGQRAVYDLGLTGIPVVNVNNACATGSSALYLARSFVRAGIADCVLALGFEKMANGGLVNGYADRELPMKRHAKAMWSRHPRLKSALAPQLFGYAAEAYMERYSVSAETLAGVAVKNHRHSVNNPYAQFQREYSLQEVLDSPMVSEPLTRLQSCPTSDGGAAAVVASERFVEEHGLWGKAVEIVGQSLVTDRDDSFDGSDLALVGQAMSRRAALQAYDESGLGPENVQVIELHDCFSSNELITYDALGLCEDGGAGDLLDSGATTYGGQWVVNPSGGLISKGHPLGATGLAQCAELTWQLRGEAEARQVDGAHAALQHNLGLGGAVVVTMYRAVVA